MPPVGRNWSLEALGGRDNREDIQILARREEMKSLDVRIKSFDVRIKSLDVNM